MSKPASEATIKNLYDNMGHIIKECFPILRSCINGLSKIDQLLIMEDTDNNTYNNYRNVLELHSFVLYVIIEASCAFRADFHSDIPIEKRINLKYIVFITSEFFKAVFVSKNKNSLWDNVSKHLSSLKIGATEINEIQQSIEHYENQYYSKDKENRDIFVHYDFDLVKLYDYLVNISEEKEARRLCDFLAIVQPLHNLLNLYSSIIVIQVQAENASTLSDSVSDAALYDNLNENLYPSIGDSLQHSGEYLDKNMQTYSMVEKLPIPITSTLGDAGIERIKEIRDYTKTAILLHYIYLDLGSAIRGYLQSESYLEKKWSLIRVNLIIYEGWKKIFKPQFSKEESLWEQYIYSPLIQNNDETVKGEVESVNSLLDSYKDYKHLQNIRHKYIHLMDRKKNNLPDLLDELLKLIPYHELNKSLDFLKLLSRIIKLNTKSMKAVSEAENNYNRQKMQEPFKQIKIKILDSKMSEKSKNYLLKIIEEGETKIMSVFN